jgi:prepilin-type N-terminal cleavage/methylation domain-containing protein
MMRFKYPGITNTKGFAFLEILLVLVVILIMSGWYFSGKSPEQQAAGQYQMSMNRANDAACKANRQTLETEIQMWQMQHQGEPITTEALQKGGINMKSCPDGGTYTIGADGHLTCSKHK